MSQDAYRLTDGIGQFPAGTVLEVTARYGPWHADAIELEPREKAHSGGKLRVTSEEVGFSESEILDETARIGDWHEYECAFETRPKSDTRITMSELEAVAEPVTTPT